MGRHARQRYAGRGSGVERLSLVDVAGEPGQHVETGRCPDGAHVRQVSLQSVEQRVAPFAIDRSQPPEVMVELAALDEVGERELIDRR